MKKYIKQSFLSAILVTLLFGCSIDDIQPIAQLTEENVVLDEASAQRLLNKLYNTTREPSIAQILAATSYWGIEQLPAGPFTGTATWPENQPTGEAGILRDYYTNLYSTINNSNFLIEKVEAGDAKGLIDPRKSEILAEARFFRALSHFFLLRTFGQFYNTNSQYGVVALTEPVRGDVSYPRNTVQETYDLILADLEYAANNGPNGVDHFYVSATTARALLAKVQLYYGDYAAASTNAMAVINNNDGYAMVDDYTQIFFDRWTSETLYAPFIAAPEEELMFPASAFRSGTPSDYFRTIADLSDGFLDGVDESEGQPFSGYDSRFQYNYGSETVGPNSLGKYPLATRSVGNTFQYLRMGEMYLIYAEAEARRQGGSLASALEHLNVIRMRADMPEKELVDQSTLLMDIMEEKLLELFIEGSENWYDFVRYHSIGDLNISDYKSTITSDSQLNLPFPDAALAGNGNLIPNP